MGFLLSSHPQDAKRPSFINEQAARDLLLDTYMDNLFEEVRGNNIKVNWNQYATGDPADLEFRHAVLKELSREDDLVEDLKVLSAAFSQLEITIETSASVLGGADSVVDKTHDFMLLNLLYDSLYKVNSRLGNLIEEGRIASVGLLALKNQCEEDLSGFFSTDFQKTWEKHTTGLVTPMSVLFRFSLNDEVKTEGVSLHSITNTLIKRGSAVNIAGLDNAEKPLDLRAPKGMLTPLSELLHSQVDNAHRQFLHTAEALMLKWRDLQSDLLFYLAALEYMREMQASGATLVYPEFVDSGRKAFDGSEMQNPILISLKKHPGTPNSITFKEKGEILILTGINQGGKTTFLRTVSTLQFFAQLGWPVTAKSLTLSPASAIVSVFSHEENTHLKHGKLGQELKAIREGLNEADADCFLLMNEPVTGTSPMENLYLSREVLTACKLLHVRGIWVTHLYDLAAEADDFNRSLGGSTISSIIARSLVYGDGQVEATYHIERGEPAFTSYASQVLRQKIEGK